METFYCLGIESSSSVNLVEDMIIPHIRIVPWRGADELEVLKRDFYPDKFNDNNRSNSSGRFRAIQKVQSYRCKGSQYLPHVIDSTAQITDAILQDENYIANSSNERRVVNEQSIRLCYTMALIRFVNGLLDPTQQSKFAVPLHTLAKKIQLPSWFVDLRHWGTHERDLPSLSMLRLTSKEALEWLWKNYWNDNKLEEFSDEDGDSSSSNEEIKRNNKFEEKINELLEDWFQIKDVLIENSWIWQNDKQNVISSNNFKVSSNKNDGNKKKKRRNDDDESPYEMIHSQINESKKIWKSCLNKDIFIEKCIKNYNSTIFQIFFLHLNNFDLEFINWLLVTFKHITNQDMNEKCLLLKKKFPSWNILKSSILKKQLPKINTRLLVMEWDSWHKILLEIPSYLSIWICRHLIKIIEEQKLLNSKKKRKQKKLKQNNNIPDVFEVQKRLVDYIDKYEKLYPESDVEFYNLSKTVAAADTIESKSVVNNNNNKESKENSVEISDMLKDLENLKSRVVSRESSSTSINKKLKTSESSSWKRYNNWTPKPFGVL